VPAWNVLDMRFIILRVRCPPPPGVRGVRGVPGVEYWDGEGEEGGGGNGLSSSVGSIGMGLNCRGPRGGVGGTTSMMDNRSFDGLVLGLA
jgi:hypothetical protein